MTHVGPAPVGAASVETAKFIEWSPVVAGALVAAALSFVFLAFGTAIGLFAASPWPHSGLSSKLVASLSIFFVLVQQIGAFMAGGYVAGRIRGRWSDTTKDESEFRDGLHGGLVWALGMTIGALLAFSAAGAAAKTVATVAGPAAATATNQNMDGLLDALLRPTVVAQASSPAIPPPTAPPSSTPALPTLQTTPSQNPMDMRAELGRIMSSAIATGGMTPETKAYVAQTVARRAGIPQQEAERRVDMAIANAREAADKARRASMLAALVTGISLVVSFGAAWWAAIKGGNHRDNSIPARFSIVRPRSSVNV